jgi:hypothetical protein
VVDLGLPPSEVRDLTPAEIVLLLKRKNDAIAAQNGRLTSDEIEELYQML